MGVETLPPTPSSLRPKPMERKLLEQTFKKRVDSHFGRCRVMLLSQNLTDMHLAVQGMCLGFLYMQGKFILYYASSVVSSGLLTEI